MPLDIWRMMALDALKMDGKKKYSFFNDNEVDLEAESIKSMRDEKEVVRFLFSDPLIRNFIVEEFISDSGYYISKLDVAEPIIKRDAEKPGDLDVVLIPFENESESIVIEVKYFKAETNSDQKARINKIEKIINASKQVNAYLKLGFHKLYFVVVLLDDARNDRTPNQILKRTKDEKIDSVFWHHDYNQIVEDIGIVFIHLIQPLNKSHRLGLTVRIKTKREPKKRSQNIRTTDKIRELLYK